MDTKINRVEPHGNDSKVAKRAQDALRDKASNLPNKTTNEGNDIKSAKEDLLQYAEDQGPTAQLPR